MDDVKAIIDRYEDGLISEHEALAQIMLAAHTALASLDTIEEA